jgi:hypothetical protein
MPFNLVNSGSINNAYYLRFAHLPLCSEKIYENYEDYFKSFIIKTEPKIPDAVPLFIMYLHYLFTLKKEFNLERMYSSKKPYKPYFNLIYHDKKNIDIVPFAISRYNQYNYILYKLLMATDINIIRENGNKGNYINDIVEICKKEVVYILINNFKDLDSKDHNILINNFKQKIKDKQRKTNEKSKIKRKRKDKDVDVAIKEEKLGEGYSEDEGEGVGVYEDEGEGVYEDEGEGEGVYEDEGESVFMDE